MTRWNCRTKKTRKFRSIRAYKQDARQTSREPWESNRPIKINLHARL